MEFLPSLFALLESSKYVLIATGSFFEGTAVMLTTGLLWHIGTVDFFPAYIALMVGDILSDIMWYILGYFGARSLFNRWGHFVGVTSEIVEKIEGRFHRYHTKILAISKLTMGFGFAVPVLVVAGMLRVPFMRFLVINILGSIVWIFFMMIIGYYFGNVLQYIPKDFQIVLAIAIPIIFLLAIHAISRRLKAINW